MGGITLVLKRSPSLKLKFSHTQIGRPCIHNYYQCFIPMWVDFRIDVLMINYRIDHI